MAGTGPQAGQDIGTVLTGCTCVPADTPACASCEVYTRERLLTCETCRTHYHPTCLGLGRYSYAAGVFTCAPCICISAAIPNHTGSRAQENAHRLVALRAQATQSSTQATYASALARYTYWAMEIAGIPKGDALPTHPGVGIAPIRIQLFLTWATEKYAYATIESTISALADWHRSKGLAPSSFVRTMDITRLMRTIKSTQGTRGVPQGKTGLSKPLLRLLIGYLAEKARTDSIMRSLYERDTAWLILGFFGMLRRSEIIALNLEDISFRYKRGKPSHVEVQIRRSKTDRAGIGATITLAVRSVDGIHIFGTLSDWHASRLRMGDKSSPLFPAWDLDRRCPSMSLRIQTGQALATRLRLYLTDLKVQFPELSVNVASYGMHSLRRGGVIAAWEAGVDIERIKSHGRWKSDAVRAYMQATLAIRLGVTTAM